MASPLLALPAEIRQQIICETFHVELMDSTYRVQSPLRGICKRLESDIEEVRSSWLPEGTIDVSVKDTYGMYGFVPLQRDFELRATCSGRKWLGVQEVRLQCYLDNAPPAPMPTLSIFRNVMYQNNLDHYDISMLPETVEKVVIDTTMPPKQLKAIEEAWPEGRCSIDGRQEKFWLATLKHIFVYISAYSRREPSNTLENEGWIFTKVTDRMVRLETNGKLPKSQVDAMACTNLKEW
ncbi:uncharacterized protein BDZ99DRAFT_525497 [Mytilinidion resinicola]|uniref:Uncharacterized protein n=1 Tax=Mytilinidion resinicola TaxID=574789 RepID=A0A6A6Y765_9PEZI|nr:uncharacterized protein BDZ99DRAFT_525497 [Mytilinidion resinicola]KAF2804666.1 hypothetical protein BDZ99DRAFT_525497 [Mytilinidion resinicola]